MNNNVLKKIRNIKLVIIIVLSICIYFVFVILYTDIEFIKIVDENEQSIFGTGSNLKEYYVYSNSFFMSDEKILEKIIEFNESNINEISEVDMQINKRYFFPNVYKSKGWDLFFSILMDSRKNRIVAGRGVGPEADTDLPAYIYVLYEYDKGIKTYYFKFTNQEVILPIN